MLDTSHIPVAARPAAPHRLLAGLHQLRRRLCADPEAVTAAMAAVAQARESAGVCDAGGQHLAAARLQAAAQAVVDDLGALLRSEPGRVRWLAGRPSISLPHTTDRLCVVGWDAARVDAGPYLRHETALLAALTVAACGTSRVGVMAAVHAAWLQDCLIRIRLLGAPRADDTPQVYDAAAALLRPAGASHDPLSLARALHGHP